MAGNAGTYPDKLCGPLRHDKIVRPPGYQYIGSGLDIDHINCGGENGAIT